MFFMYLRPKHYTEQIHAHFRVVSIFVHGLEFRERFNFAGGLEFQTVRAFIC
jgi:hypothetical protein